MSTKEDQILIQNRINELTTAIDAGDTDVQLSLWEMERTDKRKELARLLEEEANQQNAEVQQQAQAAQIGGLKEIIRSIFEAAFPKDETVKVIGLTEYENTQQTFNQLVDQAVDEDQTALYVAFNTQLEQRDEKFRLLTLQALEVQKKLDYKIQFVNDQAGVIMHYEQENNKLTEENATLQQTVNDHDEQLRQRDEEIQRLKQHEFELQQQIANAPAPSASIIDITPTKASVSLSEKIAQAKIESIKQFSNFYSDVTFKDGTTKLVHNSELPSLEIPVLPTLEQMASQNVEQSAHPEQVIHPSEVQAIDTAGVQSDVRNADTNQVVEQHAAAAEETTVITLDSLKAEIDALKTAHGERLDRLDRQANLPRAV